MTTILASLGAFLIGVGAATAHGIYWLNEGRKIGRMDAWLDPGDTVGKLPTPQSKTSPVGESSGRHALPDWSGDDDTQQLPAVGVVNGEAGA